MSNARIDVYLFDLNPEEEEVALLCTLLNREERARAERFKAAEHTRRFIVRRARLRQVLAEHSGQAPDKIRYVTGAQGKPAPLSSEDGTPLCDARSAGPALHFNTSSSVDTGLIGVTCAAPLGVDIEQKRELTDRNAVVRRFFSAAEQRDFNSVPEADKCQAFFNAWTRKEAVIKATGEGLRTPLDSFDVTLIPGQSARLLRMTGRGPGTGAGVRDWHLFEVNAGDDCAAAVAIHLPGERERGQVCPFLVLANITQ